MHQGSLGWGSLLRFCLVSYESVRPGVRGRGYWFWKALWFVLILQKNRSCEYAIPLACSILSYIHAGTHECHTLAVGIVECEVSATRSKDNGTAGCAVDTSAHASQAALSRMLLSQGVAWLHWSVIDAHVLCMDARCAVVLFCAGCMRLPVLCTHLRSFSLEMSCFTPLRLYGAMQDVFMCWFHCMPMTPDAFRPPWLLLDR